MSRIITIAYVDLLGDLILDPLGRVVIQGTTIFPDTLPPQQVHIPGIEWQALEKLGWQPYGIP